MNEIEKNEKIRVLLEEHEKEQKKYEAFKKIAKERLEEVKGNMSNIKLYFGSKVANEVEKTCLLLENAFGLETNNV